MKKLFSMLVVILLLSVTLSSCEFPQIPWLNNGGNGEPEEPEELTTKALLDNMSDAMDGLSSLEVNGKTKITLYVAATKMNIVGTSKTIFRVRSATNDSFTYFYNETDTTAKSAGIESNISTVEAFDDGKYFFSYSNDGRVKKMYSQNTSDEFMDYYTSQSDGIDIFGGYGKASHVKNADGTYTLTLKEYDSENADYFNESFGLPMENGGGRITDYVITVTVNSDYSITDIVIDYVFSNTEFSGSQTLTLTNHNNAEELSDAIDINEYTQVSDAIAVASYSKLISDRQNSKKGCFTFSMSQTATLAGSTSQYWENDKVSYGVNDDGYYFDIAAEIRGSKHTITYIDGKYKVDGELDKSTDHNDVTSKAFVDGLINPFGVQPSEIMDVTVSKSGRNTVYTFKLAPSYGAVVDKLTAIFQSAGATYKSANIHMEITVKDSELISLRYTAEALGEVRQYNSTYNMGLDIESVTDFTGGQYSGS